MKNIYLISILCILQSACTSKEEHKGNDSKNFPTGVHVIIADTSFFENTFQTIGTIIGQEEVDIYPEISGKVTGIFFNEGASVNKGDLLFKLFDSDLQAQLKKQKALLAIAHDTEKRLSDLLKINGISQQEYDNAKQQKIIIESEIELITVQINKTEIRAPFSGTIGLRNVSEGAYVNPTLKLASIQQKQHLKVDFSLPEKFASEITKGKQVHIIANPNTSPITATVIATESKIDASTRSIMVRAQLSEKRELVPGQFVKAEMQLEKRNNAIIVPSQAIISDARNKKIILVRQGKAMFTNVETGARTPKGIQITNGISKGDTVVVTGIMQLRPMADVQIKEIVTNTASK